MLLTSYLYMIVIFNLNKNCGFGAKHEFQHKNFAAVASPFGEGLNRFIFKAYQNRFKILFKLTIEGNGCTKMDPRIWHGSQGCLYRL